MNHKMALKIAQEGQDYNGRLVIYRSRNGQYMTGPRETAEKYGLGARKYRRNWWTFAEFRAAKVPCVMPLFPKGAPKR